LKYSSTAAGERRRFLNPIPEQSTRALGVPGCKRIMEHHHVDDDIIARLAGWIDDVAAGLEEARPQTWP